MIDHESIKREIRKRLRNKIIKTEEDAIKIAKRYISSDEPDYMARIIISPLLSRKVHWIVSSEKFKHYWFTGNVTRVVYVDYFGRMWSCTTGVRNYLVPIRPCSDGTFCIDSLGGSMWQSKKGRTFTCEYRTNEDELKNRISPETFIG